MRKVLLAALMLAAMLVSTVSHADIIDDLTPGHWLEIPNSALHTSGAEYNGPLAASIYGSSGPKAVMMSWSGGAYDTKRHNLLIWGGGHSNYYGNEVYAFNLDTLKWSRLHDPSDIAGYNCSTNIDTYPDGLPYSRHTYGGSVYIPTTDQMFSLGGYTAICDVTSFVSWGFDLTTNSWIQYTNAPSAGGGDISAYDPVTGHVFHNTGNSGGFMSEWDPIARTWTARGNSTVFFIKQRMYGAINPLSHQLIAAGVDVDGVTTNKIYVWNLNNSGTLAPAGYVTTGPSPAVNAPGMTWDSDDQKFVVWGGGQNLLVLDNVGGTWTYTVQAPHSDNTVTPDAPQPNGTFGRFQYVPSRHVFVLVNTTTSDVFVYKPDFTGAGCSPPTIGAQPNQSVNVNATFNYQVVANAATVYSASGLPPGITIDQNTGLINGNATTIGTYTASLTVSNNCGNASGSINITVTGPYHFRIGTTYYQDLQSALTAAVNGDTILVDAGNYVNMYGTTNTGQSLTINGVGGMARFTNTGQIPSDKGILVDNSSSLTIDHLGFTGAAGVSNNDAGLRWQAGNLTVTNSDFTSNQNGILAGAFTGNAFIQNSTFYNNGFGDGFTHGMYIGDVTSLTVDHVTVRGTLAGHHIKSRAEQTTITNVLLDDGNGTSGSSMAIDIPQGGIGYVSCARMIRAPNYGNQYIISEGEDQQQPIHATTSLYAENNVFINNSNKTVVAGIRNPLTTYTAIMNKSIFVNPMNHYVGQVSETNSQTTTDPNVAMPTVCGAVGAPTDQFVGGNPLGGGGPSPAPRRHQHRVLQ